MKPTPSKTTKRRRANRARRLSERQKDWIDGVYVDVLIWECESYLQLLKTGLSIHQTGRFKMTFIHAALGYAANIAKMLWGRPRGSDERAISEARTKRIRRWLGIRRKDKVLDDLELRNDLEHFDARLDHWSQTSTTLNIATFNIGPRGMIAGLPDSDRFLQYDPSTNSVMMLDHVVDLNALTKSVQQVYKAAQGAQLKMFEKKRKAASEHRLKILKPTPLP